MIDGGEGAPAAPANEGARRGGTRGLGEGRARDGASWLLRHKVSLPDPTEGWLERTKLEARCALTERRLTVLHAPGGFGKTALLGRCCRALREQGVVVAWLSLDEDDGPGSLAAYLAFAFEAAGLETFGEAVGHEGGVSAPASSAPADTQADYRINLLVRALERHGAPCVLALDEVERLGGGSGAVGTLNALLRRAPRNLHVGMAFREQPLDLEIAMFGLEGHETTVTVDDLRFSRSDVARFFERGLSRRELASVWADSTGWPIALRIHRNAGRRESGNAQGSERMVAGWIETRLWRGFADGDRDFVLDVALFDSLDSDLIDEVLGVRNSGRRIAAMGALAGLLSIRGSGAAMQLHPLIRDYCERRRFKETPDRFRTIHREIARALARRGRSVEALRHAGDAGDAVLLGELGERAGGVRLWLEQGLEALRTMDGLLTGKVLETHPRLALVRCAALTVAGDIVGARRVYGAAEAATDGFTRDREGGDDRALLIDHLLVYGLIEMCGCMQHSELAARTLPLAMGVIEGTDTEALFRGVFSLGLCMTHNQRAGFDPAVEWAERARAALGRDSPYLAHIDLQVGSVAMAKGHAGEAQRRYERALGVARATHLRDAGALMLGEVLAAELALERTAGAATVDGTRLSPRLLGECGAWFDIYAASMGVETELALLRDGAPAALALVEDARAYARRTGRPSLERFLSALHASVLLVGGEVEAAENAWSVDRLPEGTDACIDLAAQSWREAEMLACTRLRLLTARGAFDAARELAGALDAVTAERQLVRTRMRGLVLAMVLEHRAGDDTRAREHLAAYLRLYEETGYTLPLVREGAHALALLDDMAEAPGTGASVAGAAARLRASVGDGAGVRPLPPPLSDLELDVLALLERHRDKEIARRLNLTFYGVRYRISGIFAKLGARGRLDAVHRARMRGLLPPAD